MTTVRPNEETKLYTTQRITLAVWRDTSMGPDAWRVVEITSGRIYGEKLYRHLLRDASWDDAMSFAMKEQERLGCNDNLRVEVAA